MSVLTLDRDVDLVLTAADKYDAHVALRHATELVTPEFKINVLLSSENRRDKAFTPWLADAKTTNRVRTVSLHGITHSMNSLQILSTVRHASNSNFPNTEDKISDESTSHYASFDMRVAGMMERTLLDSGATCSCISSAFATRMGMYVKPNPHFNKIGGVGGTVSVVGTVDQAVKIGKRQVDQHFLVVEQPVAGYHVLLGQDFMAVNYVSLHFTPTNVRFDIGTGSEKVTFSRKISLLHTASICTVNHVPVSERQEPSQKYLKREWTQAQKDIKCHRQVAYTILLSELLPPDLIDDKCLPSCIRAVLQKHSTPGGTLCGEIPVNTCAKGFQAHIELEPGAGSVNVKQYRLTPLEKAELIAQVNEFIRKGWIELSSSPWSSSVLFIPKPNGKLRFCLDYRRLNQRTVKDSGNIPLMTEMLDELAGARLFSALDLASGYYQLGLDKTSRPLTAFPTPYGLYQWTVMPMGLCNAPAIFQSAMNVILRSHIDAGYCLVYLDDIIIKSKTDAEHAKHIDAVLTSLHKHNLFCQLPKCYWAKSELKYLGHLIDGKGVRPDPAKVATLDRWQPPLKYVESLLNPSITPKERKTYLENIASECRRFLGFMNYFNRFIPRYSELCFCLTNQTHLEPPQWNEECTKAWNQLKSLLSKATLMYHPDFSKPFHVYSDASIRAIGGVLIQNHEGVEQPVAYIARKLTSAEVNYTTTEQEMLAMVYCFTQWRCYLEGTQVILHTDHEPLSWLQSQALLNRRQARWMEYFQRFTYVIAYIKGDKNVVADALTRNLDIEIGMPNNDLPFQSWPHTPLHEVFSLYNSSDRTQSPDFYFKDYISALSTDVVLEFRPSSETVPRCLPGQRRVPVEGHTRMEILLARMCIGFSGGHEKYDGSYLHDRPSLQDSRCIPAPSGTIQGNRQAFKPCILLDPKRWRGASPIMPVQRKHVKWSPMLAAYFPPSICASGHTRRTCAGRQEGVLIQHPPVHRMRVDDLDGRNHPVLQPAYPRTRPGVQQFPPVEQVPRQGRDNRIQPGSLVDSAGSNVGANSSKRTKLPMCSKKSLRKTSVRPVVSKLLDQFENSVPESAPKTSQPGFSRGSDFNARDKTLPVISPEINFMPELESGVEDISPIVFNNDDVTPSSNRKRKLGSQNPISDSSDTELLHTNKTVKTNTAASRNTASHSVPGGEHSSEPDLSLSKYEVLCEELFERIRKALVVDESSNTPEKREQMHLHEHHDLLWKGNLLYIPADVELRQDLLYWHHDVPWCGHLGIEKTIGLIRRTFYWPSIVRDVNKYIQSCFTCQADKPDRRVRRPPLTPLIAPDSCWKILGMDLIDNLPESLCGKYNAIIVFVCHLSKMVRLVRTHSTGLTTRKFAQIFFEEIFPHYGLPESIVSDRGVQWNTEFFRDLCDVADIRLKLSTSYHPQTNGLTERTNEVVETALRHYVSPSHRDWHEKLPFVEFALNNSYKKSIGCTPFQMNRVTLPNTPFESVFKNQIYHAKSGNKPSSECATWLGSSEFSSGTRTALEAASEFQFARRCIQLAKDRMKHNHDKKGVTNHLYSIGDEVWMSMKTLSLRHPSQRGKMVPRFIGPIKVLKMMGPNAVSLDFPDHMNIHSTVSVSLLKPFIRRENQEPPPVQINGVEEFELESISDHFIDPEKSLTSHKRKASLKFKAVWKGSFEDSWHPLDNFENAQLIVAKYITSCVKNVRKKIYKAMGPLAISDVGDANLIKEARALRNESDTDD
jgi:hypothetical protein